jgi:hypothetical protein
VNADSSTFSASESARGAHQAGHGGGVGAEVDVDVLDPLGLQPLEDEAGLDPVGEVPDPAALAAARHGERREQRGEGPPGSGQHRARRRGDQWPRPAGQAVQGAGVLLPVLGVHHGSVGPPDGDAEHPVPAPLDLPQLAADEGVARLGILGGEIGKLHAVEALPRQWNSLPPRGMGPPRPAPRECPEPASR